MLLSIAKPSADTTPGLVDLLLECHTRIRRFLAIAQAAAQRSDVDNDETIAACQSVERYFSEALPLHMADEEESILPRLMAACPGEVASTLQRMTHQHHEHQPLVATVLQSSAALRADPQSAPRRTALSMATTALHRAFHEHLTMEETIVFPAIQRYLPEQVQHTIRDELRRRRHLA